MSEAPSHRAVLTHKRLMAAAIRARSRRSLSGLWLFGGLGVALWAAMVLAGPIAFFLVQRLPFDAMFRFGAYLPTLVLATLGLISIGLVAWAYERANRRKVLRDFQRLGIPIENDTTFTLLPDGLRIANPRMTIQPIWEAVDTVERVPDGWAIAFDQLTTFIPADSFADEAAERAFIGALAGRLTPNARARSAAAVALEG